MECVAEMGEGAVVASGLYSPPALFNRCENGREAGREAVMRDTVQFDLAWYIVLRCWGPH